MIIRTSYLDILFNTHSVFRKLTTYYALGNPHPTYDYNCTRDVSTYDGYTEVG